MTKQEFLYRGQCRFCDATLERTLSYEWNHYGERSFSVGCQECDQAESMVDPVDPEMEAIDAMIEADRAAA